MAFTATPTDGSVTPIPMSSVVPDGTNTPLALEGGPSIATGGNTLAPVSMYVKDGNDIAQGTSTDAANANSVIGQLKQIKTNTTSTNTSPFPTQDIEQSGYVAATSPPATTNAGSDTSYTFSSQVSRIIVQNNTSAVVNFAFDVAATAGSLVLQPGAFLTYPKKVTVLHLFTAAAQNINGSTGSNIVVLGAN